MWTEGLQGTIQELVAEIQFMLRASDFGLLPLLGCSVLGKSDIRLITPYMPNGPLSHHIKTLETKRIIPLIRRVAQAVAQLHSVNIIHRDLSSY